MVSAEDEAYSDVRKELVNQNTRQLRVDVSQELSS